MRSKLRNKEQKIHIRDFLFSFNKHNIKVIEYIKKKDKCYQHMFLYCIERMRITERRKEMFTSLKIRKMFVMLHDKKSDKL